MLEDLTLPYGSLAQRGPLRSSDPDYVYARAYSLHLQNEGASEEEDPRVDHMLTVLNLLDEASQGATAEDRSNALSLLRTHYRPYYEAHGLFYTHRYGDAVMIECGILGGCEPGELAREIRFEYPPAIACYEKVFFNVRTSLDRPLFILNRAVGSLIPQIDENPRSKKSKSKTVKPSAINLHRLIAYTCGWERYKGFLSTPEISDEILSALGAVVNKHEAFKVALGIAQEKIGLLNREVILERYIDTKGSRTGLDEKAEVEDSAKQLIENNPMDARAARKEEYLDAVESVPPELPGSSEQMIEDERELGEE